MNSPKSNAIFFSVHLSLVCVCARARACVCVCVCVFVCVCVSAFYSTIDVFQEVVPLMVVNS